MKKIRIFIKSILLKIGISEKIIQKLYDNIYIKGKNKVMLIVYYFKYLFKKISSLEWSLIKKVLLANEQFGNGRFYQSYPPLEFSGDRNTLQRVKTYEFDKYLNKDQEVLDIGGNLCFFSLYNSRFVKHIDIVEYNTNLANIGKELQKHEKINNVTIYNEDFKKYSTKKQYDVIFSFAIHAWVGLSFEEYINKISSHLKKGGLLFLESHDISNDPFEENLKKVNFTSIYFKDSVDHKENFRKIALLQK